LQRDRGPAALGQCCPDGNERYPSAVPAKVELDPTDEAILTLLEADAKLAMEELGRRVSLSASAVRRRIDRLERLGVITGYTVVVNRSRARRSLQAFTELRMSGTADIADVRAAVSSIPEVQALYVTTGDPDALALLQAPDMDQLIAAVARLRRSGPIVGTKTLLVADRWVRPGVHPER
jgi:DNA-binding Lrp family transcriptional regulator